MPGGTGAIGGAMQVHGGVLALLGSDRTARLAKDELRAASETAGIQIANSVAQAEVFQLNANRSERDAATQLSLGYLQARIQHEAGRRAVGTLQAVVGASGVEMSGSALDALLETTFQTERAVRLGFSAAQRVYQNLRDQAQDSRVAAKQAKRTGGQQAAATLRIGKARADLRLAQASAEATGGLLAIGTGALNIAGGA